MVDLTSVDGGDVSEISETRAKKRRVMRGTGEGLRAGEGRNRGIVWSGSVNARVGDRLSAPAHLARVATLTGTTGDDGRLVVEGSDTALADSLAHFSYSCGQENNGNRGIVRETVERAPMMQRKND